MKPYLPDVATFSLADDKQLVLLMKAGLNELLSFESVRTASITRLLPGDGTNDYVWPEGVYRDLSEEVVMLSALVFVLQYPKPTYSVDEIIWFFCRADLAPVMAKVMLFAQGVMEPLFPLLEQKVELSLVTQDADDKPKKRTRSSSIASGQ